MKYKVSVIKKIAFLVMTMALAVAMVACSGAAGKPGPAGPPGSKARQVRRQTPPTPTDTPTVEPGPVQKSKLVDAKIENGVLTVMLKSGAKYQNTVFNVKATDGTSSDTITVMARRNRPPMLGTKVTSEDAAGIGTVPPE